MKLRQRQFFGMSAVILAVTCLECAAWGQTATHAITFDDLIQMQRVSQPAISPDGKTVAYTLAVPNLETNRSDSNIWVVPVSGGAAKQVTSSGHDSSPQWSPDGKIIAFLSSRKDGSQIYLLSPNGGEAKPLTHLSSGADMVKWSPDGKTLAFTSSVYPDCKDDGCNSARDEAKDKDKVKARVYEHLLFRHWTHWFAGKRSHLFVVAVDGNVSPRDLTSGADYDVPPDERGGPEDIAFSPDGEEICFTAVAEKMEAISTNGDLFVVPTAGGEPKRITTNPGFDGNPVYSPDGRFIAYHSQRTPGYESDQWRVMLFDRRTHTHENLGDRFDRSATNLFWSADSKKIYFDAEDRFLTPIYMIAESDLLRVENALLGDCS